MRALLIFLLLSSPALAHDWYPDDCCNKGDCDEVSASAIKVEPKGYRVLPTDELIAYSSPKKRVSPDKNYHWCICKSCEPIKTRCLFVPFRDAKHGLD